MQVPRFNTGRLARVLLALAGLGASLLVVVALLVGISLRQSAVHKAQMRAVYNALPAYGGATLLRTSENWENLLIYWQSEGVLPRITAEFRSDHPVGAVNAFYREHLTAAGWQEYREPWALYPTYRKGIYRLAILYQRSYAQDWLPAGDFQVHLWTLPMLEQALGRDLPLTGSR